MNLGVKACVRTKGGGGGGMLRSKLKDGGGATGMGIGGGSMGKTEGKVSGDEGTLVLGMYDEGDDGWLGDVLFSLEFDAHGVHAEGAVVICCFCTLVSGFLLAIVIMVKLSRKLCVPDLTVGTF